MEFHGLLHCRAVKALGFLVGSIEISVRRERQVCRHYVGFDAALVGRGDGLTQKALRLRIQTQSVVRLAHRTQQVGAHTFLAGQAAAHLRDAAIEDFANGHRLTPVLFRVRDGEQIHHEVGGALGGGRLHTRQVRLMIGQVRRNACENRKDCQCCDGTAAQAGKSGGTMH